MKTKDFLLRLVVAAIVAFVPPSAEAEPAAKNDSHATTTPNAETWKRIMERDGSISLPKPPEKDEDLRRETFALLREAAARTDEHIAAARADAEENPMRIVAAILPDADGTTTPRLAIVLGAAELAERSILDELKARFPRKRPFQVIDGFTSCVGGASGSYPSRHNAFAFLIAGLLSDLVPERTEALRKRAVEYGNARLLCGAHWPSDVEAGRTVGQELAARVAASPEWRSVRSELRNELISAQSKKH
jgi:acid phosphatase (class A)